MFYFVQVSRYLGTLEKSQKIKYKISIPKGSRRPEEGHRAARGTQKGVWRGPPPGRSTEPPGWVPHPLVPYLGPIFTLREETPEQKSFFQSTSRSRRHPLFFSGRANLEAALASGEGKSTPVHHRSMTFPLMFE